VIEVCTLIIDSNGSVDSFYYYLVQLN
jgi:hypothetical protein